MKKFNFDDVVCARSGVPQVRLGTKAWVVGVASDEKRSGSHYEKFPPGTIYTIEFEDGDSVDIHESDLIGYANDKNLRKTAPDPEVSPRFRL